MQRWEHQIGPPLVQLAGRGSIQFQTPNLVPPAFQGGGHSGRGHPGNLGFQGIAALQHGDPAGAAHKLCMLGRLCMLCI